MDGKISMLKLKFKNKFWFVLGIIGWLISAGAVIAFFTSKTNFESQAFQSVDAYEKLLKLKELTDKTQAFDELYTQVLVLLADKNYASARATLADLNQQIISERQKIELAAAAASADQAQKAVAKNDPPASGYQRQPVKTEVGSFLVDIVAADLGSARVIVDTASSGDCFNDCPVLSLADYAARNSAFAGVNGSYFCPAAYPSCAGKANTFDTLLMNKDKVYFNSSNNVYSTVPAVIFGSGWVRFVAQSLEWGRDTGVDGVIANRPLLVMGGQRVFEGEGEAKEGSRGNRSFVANKGKMVFIGVVHTATVAESAWVMQALGMENALNLDDGGSTALWAGGYKVGPGRNLPNVVLFVHKQ